MGLSNWFRRLWKGRASTACFDNTPRTNHAYDQRSRVIFPRSTSLPVTEQAQLLEQPIAPEPGFSSEQLAAAATAKRMMDDYSKVLNGTTIPGKSRAELFPYFVECQAGYDQICDFIRHHDFINWKNRDEIKGLIDDLELLCQPLYKRRHEDSTLVAVLDTETTGLAADDEPVSVAVILLDVSGKKGDNIIEIASYYGLREPTVSIHPEAQRVHGLSMEALRGQSLDIRSLRKILDSADLLVAHNAKFDRRMLGKVVPEVVHAEWACSIYTLKADWAKIAGGRRSLDSLCECLGLERPAPHNALTDCRALISVLMTRAGTKRASTRMARLIRNAWAPAP